MRVLSDLRAASAGALLPLSRRAIDCPVIVCYHRETSDIRKLAFGWEMMERVVLLPLIDELMTLVRIDRQNRGHVAEIIDSIARAATDSKPASEQNALHVRLLGQFSLRGGAIWLDGPRLRTARQFIAYLILHRRSVTSRQTLTELFWRAATRRLDSPSASGGELGALRAARGAGG